jgi:glutamine synthetase
LQGGENIMGAAPQALGQLHPTLSEKASSFMGGVMYSLPALLPFTTPSVNSYERWVEPCDILLAYRSFHYI